MLVNRILSGQVIEDQPSKLQAGETAGWCTFEQTK
jgi:hypothetical protein